MVLARALLAALAAAGPGLAAEQAPAGPAAQEQPEPPEVLGDVRYRADSLAYDAGSRSVTLQGHVIIERGEGRLYAARGVLDRAAGRLRLEGGVLAIEGAQVALADAAVVDLRSNAADLAGATMYLKDPRARFQLATLTDPAAARTTGRNQLILHGKSVQKLSRDVLVARDVSLTPCDCATRPDYQVLSPEIRIDKDRAELQRPWLDLFGLPIPVGIPISLPLTDRQTGMLAPRFVPSALTTGFGIVQPAFVTLGRSWDVTVAPGWFTGSTGTTDGRTDLSKRSVRGPRLDLELRGAPAAGTPVRLEVDAVQDLDSHWALAGRGIDGLRGIARASARTEAGWGTVAIDGAAATDSMVLADTQPGLLERFLDALRTDVGAWGRAGPAIAGVGATLLQDLRLGGPSLDRRLYGAEAVRTFQRLPAAFAQLPPARLLGPLWISGEMSVARFMPLRSATVCELATGFALTDTGAPACDPATAVLPATPLARATVTRFDVAPRVQATLARGAAGSIAALGGARADAYVFDGDASRGRRRVYAIGGLRAETELSRPYGSWLHSIAPSVELRAISKAATSGAPPLGDPVDTGATAAGPPGARRGFDELDGAAPEGGVGQAVVRVDQGLWLAGAPGRPPTRVIELTLAQDVLLWAHGAARRLGDAWAAGRLTIGPLQIGARASYDWEGARFSGVSAGGQLSDARGDSIRASVQVLRAAAPESIRGGADELFATAQLTGPSGDLVGGASAGVSFRLPVDRAPITVAYGIDQQLGPLPKGTPDQTHHFAAGIETACRCAGLQLALDLPFVEGTRQKLNVRFVLDLKQLGSFGSP